MKDVIFSPLLLVLGLIRGNLSTKYRTTDSEIGK